MVTARQLDRVHRRQLQPLGDPSRRHRRTTFDDAREHSQLSRRMVRRRSVARVRRGKHPAVRTIPLRPARHRRRRAGSAGCSDQRAGRVVVPRRSIDRVHRDRRPRLDRTTGRERRTSVNGAGRHRPRWFAKESDVVAGRRADRVHPIRRFDSDGVGAVRVWWLLSSRRSDGSPSIEPRLRTFAMSGEHPAMSSMRRYVDAIVTRDWTALAEVLAADHRFEDHPALYASTTGASSAGDAPWRITASAPRSN